MGIATATPHSNGNGNLRPFAGSASAGRFFFGTRFGGSAALDGLAFESFSFGLRRHFGRGLGPGLGDRLGGLLVERRFQVRHIQFIEIWLLTIGIGHGLSSNSCTLPRLPFFRYYNCRLASSPPRIFAFTPPPNGRLHTSWDATSEPLPRKECCVAAALEYIVPWP